jgi:CheY-like chemotaxis protein
MSRSQSLTPCKKLLVLVMADPLAQILYMRLFNQLGKQENIAMEFQVAKTFEEAVECLCDYGDSFNLILMDMEMRRCNSSKVFFF